MVNICITGVSAVSRHLEARRRRRHEAELGWFGVTCSDPNHERDATHDE
jgi:hypothetical protein